MNIIPNAIYTMDKAYVDFEALARIDTEHAFFVTRAKDNMRFEIISSNFNIDKSTGLLEDHIIRLTSQKSSQLYPKPLRLIRIYDMESEDLVSVFALGKMDLKELITELQPLIQNQDVNELTLFLNFNVSVVKSNHNIWKRKNVNSEIYIYREYGRFVRACG